MRIGSRTYECTYGLFQYLQFWREHCMQKNAKVLKATKANYSCHLSYCYAKKKSHLGNPEIMFGGLSSCLIDDIELIEDDEDDESDSSQITKEFDDETNGREDDEGNDCHNDQPTTKKAKKSSDPTNNRAQKFRDTWELKPEFSKWLSRAKNDASGTLAFCKVCGCTIQARLATIRVHGKSSKHLAMMKTTTGTSKVHQKCFTLKWPPADYGVVLLKMICLMVHIH